MLGANDLIKHRKNIRNSMLEMYFAKRTRVSETHVDSYNDFIEKTFENVIRGDKPTKIIGTDVIHYIYFYDIKLFKPTAQDSNNHYSLVMPITIRNKNDNYVSRVYCSVRHELYEYSESKKVGKLKETRIYEGDKSLYIGNIPTMVGSKLCNRYGMTKYELASQKEDPDDIGGYYIIGGQEYVIINQEIKMYNYIYINPTDKQNYTAAIYCKRLNEHAYPMRNFFQINEKKEITFQVSSYNGPTKMVPISVIFRTLEIIRDKDIIELIGGSNPPEYMNEYLTQIVETKISQSVGKSRSKFTVTEVKTRDQAYTFLRKILEISGPKETESKEKEEEEMMKSLNEFAVSIHHKLFPHIGGQNKNREKAVLLATIARQLIMTHRGLLDPGDLSNMGQKRIHTSGVKLKDLVKTCWKEALNEMKSKLQKDTGSNIQSTNISQKYNQNKFSDLILKHMKLGVWPSSRSDQYADQNSISQILERKNSVDDKAFFRKVNNPVPDKQSKKISIHQLHTTQYGFFCAAQTPDNVNIGLQKFLTVMCEITKETNTDHLIKTVENNPLYTPIENISFIDIANNVRVSLNNVIIGCVREKDAVEFFETMLKIRRRQIKDAGFIHHHTSIIFDYKNEEVRFYTDHGRLTRPCFTVDRETQKIMMTEDHLKKLFAGELTWQNLIDEGIIEYCCVYFVYHNCVIASDFRHFKEFTQGEEAIKFTHLEIDPINILSITTASNPHIDRNQAPRNIYQAQMQRQTIGISTRNYTHRYDTENYSLWYCQRALVTSYPSKYINLHKCPNGQNIIIAMLCYTGNNQEDSIIINQSSAERGLFMSYVHKTMNLFLQGDSDRFGKSENPKTTQNYNMKYNYNKIDGNGMPIVEEEYEKDDVIIGKVADITNRASVDGKKTHDKSLTYDELSKGRCESILQTSDTKGKRFTSVKFRQTMGVELGDKMSTRHGQKGTIGLKLPQHLMPFTGDGITPDAITSPHGIIKRMTIGQLYEGVLAKLSAYYAKFSDGTPFNDDSFEELYKVMRETGFNEYGDEILYDGFTGEKMKAKIYCCPMYFQRLKHLVMKKVYARGYGHVKALTKQPNEGKKAGGAPRVGEMEKDAIVSHGASGLLRELFYDRADKFTFYIDDETGLPTIANETIGKIGTNENNRQISKVDLPWTSMLAIYEMLLVGVHVRLIT
jgi:DNA-directed RNA polymerase beta subunit